MESIAQIYVYVEKLEKRLQEELLNIGVGPDNSALIDNLTDKINKIMDVIDNFCKQQKISRERVELPPYAYLHKLSDPMDLVPFIKKLDVPCTNPIGVFDDGNKLIAIEQNIK